MKNSIFDIEYNLNYEYKKKMDIDYDSLGSLNNMIWSLTQEFEIILSELKDDNKNLVQRQDQINMLAEINFKILKYESIKKELK